MNFSNLTVCQYFFCQNSMAGRMTKSDFTYFYGNQFTIFEAYTRVHLHNQQRKAKIILKSATSVNDCNSNYSMHAFILVSNGTLGC
jgi:hypothetical protein